MVDDVRHVLVDTADEAWERVTNDPDARGSVPSGSISRPAGMSPWDDSDMSIFGARKPQTGSREDAHALPGRDTPIRVPEPHTVLAASLAAAE